MDPLVEELLQLDLANEDDAEELPEAVLRS
jgi:hypothetical protein